MVLGLKSHITLFNKIRAATVTKGVVQGGD